MVGVDVCNVLAKLFTILYVFQFCHGPPLSGCCECSVYSGHVVLNFLCIFVL